jgi:hypothetical protein
MQGIPLAPGRDSRRIDCLKDRTDALAIGQCIALRRTNLKRPRQFFLPLSWHHDRKQGFSPVQPWQPPDFPDHYLDSPNVFPKLADLRVIQTAEIADFILF